MKSFWKNSAGISARLAAAPKLLVTLDFDGTLSALAQTPSQARLEPRFREALRALAAAPGVSVFILSGRTLKDVRGLAGLRNLYYGGNHGIEINGPGSPGATPVRLRRAGWCPRSLTEYAKNSLQLLACWWRIKCFRPACITAIWPRRPGGPSWAE